jgi:hypothetical protein
MLAVFLVQLAGCERTTTIREPVPATNGESGRNSATGGSGGTGKAETDGGAEVCSGLDYFVRTGRCAPSYDQQRVKQVTGNCDSVRVFAGTCGDYQLWTSVYSSLGDPVLCVYLQGTLVGARVCTDVLMSSWRCGAAESPTCLSAGRTVEWRSCLDGGVATECGSDDGGAGH